MVRQKSRRNSTNDVNAEATIEEAQRLARRVIETERGKCGGNVPMAIYRAASVYGVDENSLRALWERRARKFVKAHVFLKLKQIDGWLEAKANREREIIKDVAETLERSNHPAAGLARKIAEAVEGEG